MERTPPPLGLLQRQHEIEDRGLNSILIGLCTDRRDWLSWLIRWATWSRYSHVVLVNAERTEVIEATHGQRVRKLPFDDFASRANATLRCIPHGNPAGVWKAAEKMVGEKYDDLYVLGWLFRAHWQRKDQLSCVELITEACINAGELIVPSDSIDSITPQTLYLLSKDPL